MENWYEEPKNIVNGEECHIIVHKNILPGPIICASPHAHEYIEILYCHSGTHEIMLSWKPYVFEPGDMVLINSREVHQIRAVSKEMSDYTVVRFEPELLYAVYQNSLELKYMLPFTLNEATPQKVFHANEIADTFLPDIFTELLDDYCNRPYCYDFALRTNICRIFLWVLRYWNRMGITLPENENQNLWKQFKAVFDYVDRCYDQNITAAQMANLCHMSYSYFSRMFKQVTHQNFREYLNYTRIAKSEILLVNSDLSITDIAMQTGFTSSSYFIQQFKELKKISPKQFRKKYISVSSFNKELKAP